MESSGCACVPGTTLTVRAVRATAGGTGTQADVSKLQSRVQSSVPAPSPRPAQSKPCTFSPSHCSPWSTSPSPQFGEPLEPEPNPPLLSSLAEPPVVIVELVGKGPVVDIGPVVTGSGVVVTGGDVVTTGASSEPLVEASPVEPVGSTSTVGPHAHTQRIVMKPKFLRIFREYQRSDRAEQPA